jgi:hypothetical protein
VHDILCTQRNLFVLPFCTNFMTNELLLLLATTNVGWCKYAQLFFLLNNVLIHSKKLLVQNFVLGSSWTNSLIQQVLSFMFFSFMWHVVIFLQGIGGWGLSVHQSTYREFMFRNSWAQPHIFLHVVYIGHLMLIQVLVASTWSNLNQLLLKWCLLKLHTSPKWNQGM